MTTIKKRANDGGRDCETRRGMSGFKRAKERKPIVKELSIFDPFTIDSENPFPPVLRKTTPETLCLI